jgi:hypothetical protein
MPEISKQIANREAIARTVTSSADLHGPEIVKPLELLLFPDGTPKRLTLEVWIEALGSTLQRATDEIHRTDIALAGEVADDAPIRTARDEKVSGVRESLIDYAGLIAGTYGDTYIKTYGLAGITPRFGDELLNTAENVVSLLRANPFSKLEPKRGRRPLDATEMAKALEVDANGLRDAMRAVKTEDREYELALGARDEAVNKWNTVYRGVAETLSAWFMLAGRTDLADRVRPTARRRSGQPEEPDISTDTGSTPVNPPA